MNYRETDHECPSCGATAFDRKHNKPHEPQGLEECPYCANLKCCMCNMGDNVECPTCEKNEALGFFDDLKSSLLDIINR